MIQKEYFKTLSTRELLTYRRAYSCRYPRFEGDKDNGYSSGSWLGYNIDYDSLYDELSTRPHVATGKEAKLLRKLRSENHMSEKEVREIPKFRQMLSDAQKSESLPKIKDGMELHPLIKKICVNLNLHPSHPKIKEEINRLVESKELDDSLYYHDLKELKKGHFFIIDGYIDRYHTI